MWRKLGIWLLKRVIQEVVGKMQEKVSEVVATPAAPRPVYEAIQSPLDFEKQSKIALPTDATDRKEAPIAAGVLDYFPNAIAAVAHVSWKGSQQHHPGAKMHWDRSKSSDESDALIRHFMERGTLDTDGIRHSAKIAWRALALLQKEIEAETNGSKVKSNSGSADGPYT